MQMSPIDWAKRPFQKYADFSGRAPRAEFWWFTLAISVLMIGILIVERSLGLGRVFLEYGPMTVLLLLATIVPSLAVQVRRLHDTDRTGWWLAAVYAPYVGLIATMPGVGSAGMAEPAALSGSVMLFGLLGLIVLIVAIVLIVFYCLPGTAGPNRYGPDPYGSGDASA